MIPHSAHEMISPPQLHLIQHKVLHPPLYTPTEANLKLWAKITVRKLTVIFFLPIKQPVLLWEGQGQSTRAHPRSCAGRISLYFGGDLPLNKVSYFPTYNTSGFHLDFSYLQHTVHPSALSLLTARHKTQSFCAALTLKHC